MTAAELADATREFDQPFSFERGRPMTRAERAEERRLRSGRSGRDAAHRKISVSLEQSVLDKTDAIAKKRGLNRSELIARLVVAGLAHGGA